MKINDINEEINRIKSLFTEERLYGNLIINEQFKALGDFGAKAIKQLDTIKSPESLTTIINYIVKNSDGLSKNLGLSLDQIDRLNDIIRSFNEGKITPFTLIDGKEAYRLIPIEGNIRYNVLTKYKEKFPKVELNIDDLISKKPKVKTEPKDKSKVITSVQPKEDTILTKALNVLSNFIRGKELTEFLNKIQTIQTFNDFKLKAKKSIEASNGFDITIYDSKNNKEVGILVAMVYKSKETGLYNLQIRKAEIYPEYKGGGIMRKFYQEFNDWLKTNFDNFDKFTSDFIFLYNKETGKYDGFNMWEDLVKKGLARRLGPDKDYIPPTTPPKNGMGTIQ